MDKLGHPTPSFGHPSPKKFLGAWSAIRVTAFCAKRRYCIGECHTGHRILVSDHITPFLHTLFMSVFTWRKRVDLGIIF